MKCQIPQISWHGRDPVLSIDFQPIQSDQYRLASGGTDSHVLIWYVTYRENKSVNVECASDLYRHNKSVNVVRFSPNGDFLASGDDEGAMFIWQLKEREQTDLPKDDDNVNKEEWYPVKLLRGHLEDIYDISWSKDGNFLVSASMDNTAIIWDMQKFVKVHMFSDFKGYVQGVSWDPCNQFIASVGSDRTLRIHNINSKKAAYRISKAPWTNSTEKGTFKARLFYDDTLKSYCRRLTFTPDGELLIVPSGIVEKGEKLLNTCYIFSRYAPNKPVITLPTGDKYTIAVRFNPFLYKLRGSAAQESSNKESELPKPLISLPYRMIFAVAACDSILMYDTEQLLPFAYISNIHYTHLTDLTWSPDGFTLVASSTDGYCSFIVFTKEELGEIYVPEKPKVVEQILESCKNENMDVTECSNIVSVAEDDKDKTPIASKGNPLATAKSPSTGLPQTTNESMTPTSKNSQENKKSAKKSPKMCSIKKFFVAPKTAVTADKNVAGSSSKGATFDKVEPEVITLIDSPVKGKNLSDAGNAIAKTSKIPEPELNNKQEPMDIYKNASHEISSSEKETSVEKQAKCKVRLDFTDKSEAGNANQNVIEKKSPKMSIKKFFVPKAVTEAIKTNENSRKCSTSGTKIVSVASTQSQSCETVKIEDTVVSNVKNELSHPAVLSSAKGDPMDIDENLPCEMSLDQVETLTETTTHKQAKVEPVMNIDENASDGDNTSTSMSDMKILNNDDATKENENDWKLELSQDEDITPMEVASAVIPETKTEVSKPSKSKVTPKRRIPFVTLSSKATLKQ